MHAHAPGESLNDNMVVGNTVVSNGADTGDTHTPGRRASTSSRARPLSGNMISGNSIQSESYDVALNIPTLVEVQFNSLLGLNV